MIHRENQDGEDEEGVEKPRRDHSAPPSARPKKREAQGEKRREQSSDRVGVSQKRQRSCERNHIRGAPFVPVRRALQAKKKQSKRERIERHFHRNATDFEKPRRKER